MKWTHLSLAALAVGSSCLAAELVGDAWSDERNPVRVAFKGERLEVWSLRPIRDVPPPTDLRNQVWAKEPLDAFILQKLEANGLTPAPAADRGVLVRRLYQALIGLPPSAEETEQFVNDASPKATEQLVDRLLAKDSFGEHWGRWWLDAVRYADSNGYDWDEFRPAAWRYRDYVIRSLNADKPFSEFIREQLAGDEMVAGPPKDAAEQDRLLATGYLRIGPWDNSSKLFKEEHKNLAAHQADLTETTATVFLGMTMACCRCHDHKTEPLLQADHYRLRAVFAGTKFADDLPLDLAPEQESIKQFNAGIDAKEKDKNKARERYKPFTTALLMTSGDPGETHILQAGDADKPTEVVPPGLPTLLHPEPLEPATVAAGNGRRTAFAKWLVAQENPLTARVLVNRMWQGMMGRGIVSTVGDFGLSGARPTHPELLDFLATSFVHNGWSLKKFLRRVALSATFGQSAYVAEADAAKARELDAENNFYWRMNPRRLTAEQLRDALLAASGLLQPSTGGPPRWPELPESVLASNPAFYDDNKEKTKGWYPSPPDKINVRSIYLVQKRSVHVPLLEAFDLPDNFVSCSRREISTSAPQAFALLNNPLAQQCAKALAEQARKADASTPEATARQAWRRALGRWPTEAEMRATANLRARSLEEFCRAILNLNEFVYVD